MTSASLKGAEAGAEAETNEPIRLHGLDGRETCLPLALRSGWPNTLRTGEAGRPPAEQIDGLMVLS